MEKKAKKPVILDVGGTCGFCDYFIILSAETGVQVKAICDAVLRKSKEAGYAVHHFEDDELSRWILVDLFDVILHIFTEESRAFYNLEHLWSEAHRLRIPRKKKPNPHFLKRPVA